MVNGLSATQIQTEREKKVEELSQIQASIGSFQRGIADVEAIRRKQVFDIQQDKRARATAEFKAQQTTAANERARLETQRQQKLIDDLTLRRTQVRERKVFVGEEEQARLAGVRITKEPEDRFKIRFGEKEALISPGVAAKLRAEDPKQLALEFGTFEALKARRKKREIQEQEQLEEEEIKRSPLDLPEEFQRPPEKKKLRERILPLITSRDPFKTLGTQKGRFDVGSAKLAELTRKVKESPLLRARTKPSTAVEFRTIRDPSGNIIDTQSVLVPRDVEARVTPLFKEKGLVVGTAEAAKAGTRFIVGFGETPELISKIDIPIIKKTGEVLKKEIKQGTILTSIATPLIRSVIRDPVKSAAELAALAIAPKIPGKIGRVAKVETIAIPTVKGVEKVTVGGLQVGQRGVVLGARKGSKITLGKPDITKELQALKPGTKITPGGLLETQTLQTSLEKIPTATVRAKESIPVLRDILKGTQKIKTKITEPQLLFTERLSPAGTKIVLDIAKEESAKIFGSLARRGQIPFKISKFQPRDIDITLKAGSQAQVTRILETAQRRLGRIGVKTKIEGDALKVKRPEGVRKLLEVKGGDIIEGEVPKEQILGFLKPGKPIKFEGLEFTGLSEELRGVTRGLTTIRKVGDVIEIFPVAKRVKDISSVIVASETFVSKGAKIEPALKRFKELFGDPTKIERVDVLISDFSKTTKPKLPGARIGKIDTPEKPSVSVRSIRTPGRPVSPAASISVRALPRVSISSIPSVRPRERPSVFKRPSPVTSVSPKVTLPSGISPPSVSPPSRPSPPRVPSISPPDRPSPPSVRSPRFPRPPIIPPVFPFRRPTPTPKRRRILTPRLPRVTGFVARAKVKGRFVDVSKVLPEKIALFKGSEFVKQFPAQSFLIEKRGVISQAKTSILGKVSASQLLSRQFRRPRIKGVVQKSSPVFVERRFATLSQPGERRGVIEPGLRAIKRKRIRKKIKKRRGRR